VNDTLFILKNNCANIDYMVKISSIFALGIFIALIPFMGFPNDAAFPVRNILYVVSGALVAVLSVLIRKDLEEVIKHSHSDFVKTDTFAENNPNIEETKK
jgi:hypothetical protein